MNVNGGHEIRRHIGEIYERVVTWIADRLKVDVEEVREPLHEVLKRVLAMPNPRIEKLEQYLTRATVRQYRRSNGNGKVKLIYFGALSKEDLERVFETPAPGSNPAEQAAENEILALAKEEIEKMPPRRREVMRLFLAGLAPEEIAAALGIKVGTVWSHFRHAVETLRMKFPAED